MSSFSIDWSELSLQVMTTFGHFLWQACVVAIALLAGQYMAESLGDRRMRRRRGDSPPETDQCGASIRYVIACLAFFALPICVVATFVLVHQSRGSFFLSASIPADSPALGVAAANELSLPVAGTYFPVFPPQGEMLAETQMPNILQAPVAQPLVANVPDVSGTTWAERFQPMAPHLLFAYSVGVGLMLLRFVASIVGSSRLRRKLSPNTDPNLLKIIVEHALRLGLKRVPIISLCQRVSVPVVVGIVKPMILLPPALLCGLNPQQLAAILSHEMAHIRRNDVIVNLLQRIVEALLFFHPVTWWISRRIRIERENCCDDLAAAGCGRLPYAGGLLQMAELCATVRGLKIAPQLESLAADGGSTSQLGYRIRRLLGEDESPRISLTRSAIASITLAAVFGGLSIIAVAQSARRIETIDRIETHAEEAQQALIQKGSELSRRREDLVRRIDEAAGQRNKAKRYSSDYFRLDQTLKNQELLLAKFDFENATANIVVPNAPQATPERIAELRELLRFRWGLAVDGIQVGLALIGDRNQFEPSERITFQVYIRNATEEQITQKLRWFDAANSTSLLRSLSGSSTNISLSIRSGSSPGQETEQRLEPGEIRELPRGRFELNTAGLHPGVYSINANFPVIFPNQTGESETRIARPIDSGGIEIRIDADKDSQLANQAITTETKISLLGEPNMNDDLKEISELIASGKTMPRELNDKYDAVHLNLTAAERLKSVKLLAVPDFVMQVLLSEPTYSCAEKVGLLSELKDLNFGKMEFGLQECMANVATEYAQADPASTREWLAQFHGAEYGVGMGLTAVLKAAKQKDPATSLEILRSLSDAEGECIVTCGDIPKYDLPASDWLKEVQRFKSHALRSCFLGGPMVFHFGEESPEAALDYILSIPKETRTPQRGYQLVSCVLRSKRFTWTEILDWMETKLPIETRSPEHYGLLADTWSQQDNASFQLWFQELKDPLIRDEAIRGIQAIGQPQDWAAMLALAQQITDQTKRQVKVAWVLNAWKLTDPSAALAQLDNADVSKERRTQLHRDITARLAQVATVSQPAFIPQVNPNREHADKELEQQIPGQWDISPTPATTGILPQAESMTLMFSEQGKFERYVQKQEFIEFAAGSWRLDGNKVSVKLRPFAMQPTDNAEVEATLQLDAPDSLIVNGTRFLKRSPATPVTLDAKHPLHGIASDLLSKLNASAPQAEDANHVMRMLNTSDPHETWQLVQLSDKPAMSATQVVNRFDASRATGYRLLFTRDYRESANTMQQAVLLPSEIPFRLRTEQIELVLFAVQPMKAPVELKSHIAWLPAQSRMTTHDMCLGEGQGYTWFVRAPLHVSDRLIRGSQLVGGDDMLATLVQSAIFTKNMPPGSDANVASAMLVNYGDHAVAAVEQAVRRKKPEDEMWHIIGSLAGIRTEASTTLLIQLYQSDDADIRRAAAYSLVHKPYRHEASRVYLDLLKNRMSVEASTAACIELDLKEAIPILVELFKNTKKPSSLGELHTIFEARRTLEGNPTPRSLLDASEVIYQSRATDPAVEGSEVGNAMEQFTDSVDHEAVIMLALQMANYRTKGSSDHVRGFGTTILKSQKSAQALNFMAKVVESLPSSERDQLLQSMRPFAPEK